MPYADVLAGYQKKVDNLLGNNLSSVPAQEDALRGKIASYRTGANQDLQDVLAGAGSVYGGSPSSTLAAGNASRARSLRSQDRNLNEQIGRSGMSQKLNLYNLIYQTALSNLLQSGMDIRSASDRAHQLAMQQSGFNYEATQSALNRATTQQKQDIAAQYPVQAQQIYQQNYYSPDPYEQAAIGAIFGTAGQAAGVYALNEKLSAKSREPQPLAQEDAFAYNAFPQ